ncbi:hypothetical protein LMH87_001522 [Akanthomyces muscarius]|uniref:Uncharacterized protein n=1 Tax=Akanthomyces muscarius TaxID=2231603 RepID=A0A9W8Q4Z5_AKAMU|nr:hypothetical protein LMH87_001522 [Akanthomyces muscarius]KAJ4146969.1 hypothetical protein LMH87_001522 [Akanthomyces muscarius]
MLPVNVPRRHHLTPVPGASYSIETPPSGGIAAGITSNGNFVPGTASGGETTKNRPTMMPVPASTRSSIQTGKTTHEEFNSALVYMNHSRAPTLELEVFAPDASGRSSTAFRASFASSRTAAQGRRRANVVLPVDRVHQPAALQVPV